MGFKWEDVAGVGGLAGAFGSVAGAIGEATGSSFLQDAGGLAAKFGALATQVGAAGAFQSASSAEKQASLIGAAPLVNMLGSVQKTTPATKAGPTNVVTDNTRQSDGASNAPAPLAGILDAIGSLIAAPFKLLGLGKKTA